MAVDIDSRLNLETRRLCSRIEGAVENEQWADAHEYVRELTNLLAGKAQLARWRVVVAVASPDREWYRQEIVTEASSRMLAVVNAEADIRLADTLPSDALVRVTVKGLEP